jgi:hypothetical protein
MGWNERTDGSKKTQTSVRVNVALELVIEPINYKWHHIQKGRRLSHMSEKEGGANENNN